jgi:hypothetical protein
MVYDLWDCVATIPPHPHYIGELCDGYDVASAISDPDSIFFRCTLRPINATKGRYNRYSEDIDVDLFFFIWKTLMSACFFDGASQGSRRGSHMNEINTWLWIFGRPQPRVGGLSVAKNEKIRRHSRPETSRRAWKTRQARRRAADEEESS